MNHRLASICSSLALALFLVGGVHSPARAQASAEAQDLALQLVQRAELKKLAMLPLRAHLWAQMSREPIDPGLSTKKDQYFSQYECLRYKDGSPFEVPLAKSLVEDLTMEDMRGLLEGYAGPAGDEAKQLVFWRQIESLGLPKSGEYASFLTPPRISSTQPAVITQFISSERFARMMKPLTQPNQGYLAAISELVRQCDEVFIPALRTISTNPSYPAIARGGIQDISVLNEIFVPATRKTSVPPSYPAIAKRAGIQGDMVIGVYVDASGQAKQAWIVRQWFNARDMPGPPGKRSTADVFNEIGISHAMNSTYAPATRDGVPVDSVLSIPMRFVLQK